MTSKEPTTRVAVAQLTSNDDVTSNMNAVERCVRVAAERGAALVLIPECFAFLGPEDGKLGLAEALPASDETLSEKDGPRGDEVGVGFASEARRSRGGAPTGFTPLGAGAASSPRENEGPILARCRSIAESNQIEVVYGGFWERSGDGRVRNACVQVRADGSVGAIYRKIHLFDVDLADGTRLCESGTVQPGEELVVADTPAGKMGLSVCYDLRFSELYRGLVDRGATLLAIPAAFTLMTGKDHWEVLLRARAIEQQSYVLAAAQVGRHVRMDGSGRRESWGHAMIIDPWGIVLAQCGAGEGVAVAEVDQAEVERIRRQLPSLKHRRL